MPRSKERANPKGRIFPLVFAALAVFGAFGSLQMILAALNVHLITMPPAAPTSAHGVALVQASANPAPVVLPVVAQPVNANQALASMPNFSSSKETTLVSAEDARIRVLIHDSAHVHLPTVHHYPGALATLMLPARTAAYTVTDLVTQGAAVMLSGHVALLQENVFVMSGAKLNLGAPDLSALYLASSTSGFTSIIGWGGNLSFTGTSAQPLTIMSWNQATKSAVADKGTGRPYIREIGGAMTFGYARVSSLGFWSGRTGGVAWTGTSRASSKGSAVDSTFTGDTYGAFVSRAQGVTFSADLFESNELDGLHIHRHATGSQVTSSAAARNGGNGFVVDRATTNTLLRGDVSQHNAANGYLFDGRPLVSGASASGGSNVPSSGTVLEGSSATGNGHTGVLMEGGTGTVVKSDHFCSPTTAIALRTGVTNAVITGNYLDCAPRSGISVGPSAPGAVIYGNIVDRPSIGLLIRNSGSVSLYNNQVTSATVFGVSARGTSGVGGVGNVMSGTGARAVDVRTNASVSGLSGTNTSGWTHHNRVTFISYLEFHPLASLWLGILVVILLAAGWSFRRKLPDHPYPASVRRTYELSAPADSSAATESRAAHLQPAVGRHTAGQPALGRETASHLAAATTIQPAVGRHTAPQSAAGRQTALQPSAATTIQPAVGRHTASQPAVGRHTSPQRAPQPAAGRPSPPRSAPQPAAGRPSAPQPAARRYTSPQPAPQPTAGRPSAPNPALQPAPQRAAGRPSAPYPALQPAPQPPAGHPSAPHPTLQPAPQPAARRPSAPRPALPPAVGRPSVPNPALQPATGRYTSPQPAPQPAGRPSASQPAPQPAAGRPAAGPAGPPAPWNAPTRDAAGRPQPAPRQQPALPPAPSHHRPPHHEAAYHEAAYREPAYHEPAYREPAPGSGRWPESANGSAPSDWNRPVQDAARWRQPAPAPLPAPLPAAPSGASGGWPQVPASHGGVNGNRVTRGQPALPSDINRPSERERTADPSGEDVRDTRSAQKGVWD